ncbi:putative E3 ubiquitin-protein ligase RNF217, partial [Stegodyphus mimosarum]
MEVSNLTNSANEKLPLEILNSESSSNYIKSWPVQLPVPLKTFYIKGTRNTRHKPYHFKYTYMKNWLIPLDGPVPLDHVHFLLDCFVVSAGPVPPQLGRYHPQSDPEEFVQKAKTEDTWSVNSTEEEVYWAKMGTQKPKASSTFRDAGTSSMANTYEKETEDYSFERCFSTTVTRFESRHVIPSDFPSSEDIVRELAEMRLVLERLLENHDMVNWDHPHGLRDVLELLPEDMSPNEPSPHYPVGDWQFDECGICYESQWLYRRACCGFSACSSCLQSYFSSKIDEGQVKIECCNTSCSSYVHRDEISARLSIADKEKFHKLLILANQDSNTKTCPRCSHVTKIASKSKKKKE